jgi:RNA polymerase sigma factor (sigma-70 family)
LRIVLSSVPIEATTTVHVGIAAISRELATVGGNVWDASDEALLAGLGTGDRAAALAFVRRFQRRVYGLALLIVRDGGRAEEVAQEAFVRAWRHAPAFDPRRGSVTTWLLSITRNLAIDALRVERVRPVELMAEIDLGVSDPRPGPADTASDREALARVATALKTLPAGQRRALVAATLYGQTAREISEQEGIPLGTAKTRIRTGLIRVRDELAAVSDRPDGVRPPMETES